MIVSDYTKGKVIANAPIGAGVDGAAFDPRAHDAFFSNADGTLTVVHQESPDLYKVTQTIKTPRYSRNLGIDATSHRIFVAAAQFAPSPSGNGKGSLVPDSFQLIVIEKTR